MVTTRVHVLVQAARLMQSLAQGAVVVLAVAAVAATGAALLGWVPWPQIALFWNGAQVPQAGMAAQIALTALLVLLCLFLPANARMARLERSHRSFILSLEDVRRAYEAAHAADRRGVFALSGEFAAMRERLDHLRRHPDLGHLEPEVLELAAQMSFASRDLARVYSDERVGRARTFLQQRQHEADAMAERLALARTITEELRRWLTDIESEERQAQLQIRRLEADLREVLPTLGYSFDTEELQANVEALPKAETTRR